MAVRSMRGATLSRGGFAERLEGRTLLSVSSEGEVFRPEMTVVKSEAELSTRGAPGYQIQIRFTDNNLTASQKAIFTTAAARWQAIILGELSDVTGDFDGDGFAETVDDLRIDASAPFIDGPGGILGSAGPQFIRSSNFLPITGVMRFDSADIAELEADGELDEVILHEMAHVMGLGTIWDLKSLITGAGGSDPRFIGAKAVAQYQAIFGSTHQGNVPVENTGGGGTRDSHWREGGGTGFAFDNELMTGFLDSGNVNPISLVTVGQFADLGYLGVNMNGFDVYTPPGGGNARPNIGSLSDTPDPVSAGSMVTLTANNVADTNGTIASVRFYRETNGKPGLQVLAVNNGDTPGDLLLSTDTSSVGGWSASVSTVGLANGTYTYYAQATDNLNLVSPSVSTTNTIGTTSTARVSGVVFNDLNGDGFKQAGEPGLQGWRLFLDNNNNGVWESATEQSILSGVGGAYAANLPPGTYRGDIVVQAGWQQTAPAAGSYFGTLSAGQNIGNLNFGVRQVAQTASLAGPKLTPALNSSRERSLWSELEIA